ncbi:MAG: lytic transglycosylase domain-containing protein [Ignisphaera sp.]|nr:lytic transglycosylase domain-containing protein [Ignisphaera sp.]
MNQRSEIKTPEEWNKELHLNSLEKQFELPHNILMHIINRESTGNPNKTSRADAKGLFGITASSGFQGDPLNHHKAAWFVANILKNLLHHYTKMGYDRKSDAMEKTIAAYNWGMGKVAQNNYNTERSVNIPFPTETKNYIDYMKAHGVIQPKSFRVQPIPTWFKDWSKTKKPTTGIQSTLK